MFTVMRTSTAVAAGMVLAGTVLVAPGGMAASNTESLVAWGLNNHGQLGNNSTTNSIRPVAVDTSGVLAGTTVTAISAGGFHSCAVADGRAYCWGSNGIREQQHDERRWCRWRWTPPGCWPARR